MKKLMIIIVFLLVGIQSVHAMPVLKLSDGTTTIMVVDEGPNDALPGVIGGVGYLGSVGVFNLTVTTGFVTPFLGTSTFPSMDLNSVAVSSSKSGGTLTIMFTDTDFGPIGAPVFETMVGGTSRGTVNFNTYVDSTNTAFGTNTLIGNLGTYGPGAFSGSTSATYSPSNPFSMTAVATITHGGGSKVSGFDLNVNVAPEPISSTLFVIGAAILGGRYFSKRKNK